MANIIPYATILNFDYIPGESYAVSYNVDIHIEDQYLTTYSEQHGSGKYFVPSNLTLADGIFETNITLNFSDSLKPRKLCFRYNANGTVDNILKMDAVEVVDDSIKQFYISDMVPHKINTEILKEMLT